jgi:hypothetical protein
MKAKFFFLCSLIVLSFTSCEHDFIEDDLSGIMVSVIAPADDDTVAISTPLMWWNEINGARSYRIQIVYPDFSSPQQLLYDTAVVGDRFIPSLVPGNTYYWRIRPENGSSEGNWVTRSLTIDSSLGLSNQSVVITTPANNGYETSTNTVLFAWNPITSATFYRIEIVNQSTAATVVATTTTSASYQYYLVQGDYEFRVRGENSSSFTSWSTRTFSVDQTAPSAPVLVAPADDAFYASVPSTLVFSWLNSSDALNDSLFVSTDSTFTSGSIIQLSLPATQSGYNWTGAAAATTYYWRVRSSDGAGNLSTYSSIYRFDVN